MIGVELQKDNLWAECRRDSSEWKLEAERKVKKKKKRLLQSFRENIIP